MRWREYVWGLVAVVVLLGVATACGSGKARASSTSSTTSSTTSASTSSSSSVLSTTSPSNPTMCRTDRLSATAYPGSGAGGHEAVVVVVSNTGADVCTLDGYPVAVWYVSVGGHRLPGEVVKQATPPPTTVRLTPGGKASTTVWSTSPGVPSASYCQPTATSGVSFVPPAQTASLFAKIAITVCGSNNMLGTTPFVSGTSEIMF